ncbi:hypothetical protein ACP70R_008867 [Stipagrostis hirtigluma subsp. patula]
MTELSDSPAAADAVVSSDPRRVLLFRHGCKRGSTSGADAKTLAATLTSDGYLFRVSFLLAPPPASTVLYFDWPGGAPVSNGGYPYVLAAHGDSVLFEVRLLGWSSYRDDDVVHYFLYVAGAARPPSLLQLPAGDIRPTWSSDMKSQQATGLLRRGEDEFLVAQLEVPEVTPRDWAELCVLHPGRGSRWELKRVPIIVVHGDGRGGVGRTMKWWQTDETVPVGDRFLCWVDYLRGFLTCDMAADEANLKLRYVPLPVAPPRGDPSARDGHRPHLKCCRKLGAAGDDAVRLVIVDPPCRCGQPGKSTCARGLFAFTVTTWTLSLCTDGPMAAWVKGVVLDSDELWAFRGYEGLPRVPVEFPVVSSGDPDIVYFVVREDHEGYNSSSDKMVWVIEVDMRTKAVGIGENCPLHF